MSDPNAPTNCPHCNTSLLGDPIPEDIKQYYSDGSTHWKREIGVEVRSIYDGVYFYRCPDCEGEWGGYRALKGIAE